MTSLNLSNQITLNVDTFEDQNDGNPSNGLSLRDAIIIANSEPQNKYIINLPQGTYNLTLDSGLLIASDITIQGNNSDGEKTIIDGSGVRDNIFSLGFEQSLLTLDTVTLANSSFSGIRVFAPSAKVNLLNSEVINNQGGGIINQGTMSIDNSLILDNFSFSGAGGIQNIGTGVMVITDSTIARNTSQIGAGGIINDFIAPTDEELFGGAGNLTIINTTITDNVSFGGNGGGILARRTPPENPEEDAADPEPVTTTIVNSTIVNNTAVRGSGIFSEEVNFFNNRLVLQNSVVANNIVPTELVRATQVNFPTFQLEQNPPVDFADQFVWDLVDGTDELIEPPSGIQPFRQSFYDIRVLFRNEDPFSQAPPEGLDLTANVSLDNIIFNADADVEFVFNQYSPSGDVSDRDGFFTPGNGFSSPNNNLISNEDQNFQFAFTSPNGSVVFLDTEFEFDDQGKLVLVLSAPSINDNINNSIDIFLADQEEIFEFDTFNNNLIVNDENKRQAPFVRGSDNNFLNFEDVVELEPRTILESEPITDIPLPNDIAGFFNQNSRSNLIGASDIRTNGILNGQNSNIVGNSTDPLDPQLIKFEAENGQIAYIPSDDSPAVNSGNNAILGTQPFFTANPVDQLGNPRTNNGTVDIGSVESGFIDVQSVLTETDSLLNTPLIRFQNRDVAGTYLYAQEQEAQQIRSRYPNFIEEGQAFKVADQQADGLIRINRFQNTDTPGTYLFATEAESVSIRQNHQNFKEEGVAFYVYGADADIGEDVYRFQSLKLPGTYLFALEGEKDSILANYSSDFRLEGVAFEVVV
ncbi:hypothetical protein H6G11_09365 [Cyanobacterium aponinum FACHB-4101]|uniref:right-handed parallel beta-helix repeat-containing protein n=1 Tax=Cyanobacterium aponinum TaxID=379064 RepID=UPI00167FEBC6|nr:right-handed parallel beta-helix repeat-containing protein [Cyanobacterium aponinum]MBD2394461.1 hypothetical protein [Cyanobacterium aponinum FACHB-4101]